MVFNVLQQFTDDELLSCEAADEIALILVLFAPDSYEMAARLPGYCRPQDVAMISVALIDVTGYIYHQHVQDLGIDQRELVNRSSAIGRLMNQNPKYSGYVNDLTSLSTDRIMELCLGYLRLPSSIQRIGYLAENSPQIFSSGVDYYLATTAYAAHHDEEYDIEADFMRFRKALVIAKESGQFS
jgi:hypothetical protein